MQSEVDLIFQNSKKHKHKKIYELKHWNEIAVNKDFHGQKLMHGN